MKISENIDLILASRSPRRKYLLEKAGVKVCVIPSEIDESSYHPASPQAFVRELSYAKAEDISRRYPDHWVLGADTIVVIQDTILGKPKDADEARRMLSRLSGQKHQVLTGYSLCHGSLGRRFTDVAVTDVFFKKLSPQEIDWYISSGEPFDKAGAYAIQGIGTFIVKRINGSYTNVVGLPVCEVLEYLIQAGIKRHALPNTCLESDSGRQD